MSRRFKFVLAPLLALVLILAGCGDGDGGNSAGGKNGSGGDSKAIDDPNAAVLAAFSDIEASTMDITVSLDATGAELAAAMEAELTGDPSEQAILDLLASGEIHMVSSAEGMSMAVAIDGATVFEYRMIDQTVYVRLDTAAAVDLMGSIDPAGAAEMSASLEQLPMMMGGDPSMSFLGDLLNGDWVSLEVPAESALGGLPGTSENPEELDAELAAVIAQIVDENSVVTPAGEARGGDRFLVEVRVADLMTALSSHPLTAEALELSGSGADIDEALAEMRADGVAEVWEIDVVLIDGQLSSVRIDLANLSTEMPEGSSLPVLITLSPSPSAPSAPADHTPVPMVVLEQLMGGMMAGV